MRSACPDVKIVLDHVVHQDDTAFARWTATMTVTGEGLGVSPNGQRIEIRGMSACRAENGVITEGWNVWDQMGMARQLGLLQGPVTQLFA
jgi:predicted ester cyclase